MLDVGTNVGNFFSDYHKSFKKTYAFEPNKNLLKILDNKFKKFDDINCYPESVGNKNEEIFFILLVIKIVL